MAYIAGLIVAGLFFLALNYFTELTKSNKLTITAVLTAIIVSAIAFNAYSTAKNEKMMQAVLKYKQSKTIRCSGTDINKSTYTLSIGTYTFIGKENTPNYAQMISASTCE